MNIPAILPTTVPEATATGVVPNPGAEFPDMFAALLAVPASILPTGPAVTSAAIAPAPVCLAPRVAIPSADAPPVDPEKTAEPDLDTGEADPDADALVLVAAAATEPLQSPSSLVLAQLPAGVPADDTVKAGGPDIALAVDRPRRAIELAVLPALAAGPVPPAAATATPPATPLRGRPTTVRPITGPELGRPAPGPAMKPLADPIAANAARETVSGREQCPPRSTCKSPQRKRRPRHCLPNLLCLRPRA